MEDNLKLNLTVLVYSLKWMKDFIRYIVLGIDR
jgi:hypothetical protein